MSEVLEAAVKELQDIGQSNVVREVIAGRIIAAARFGERDPVRLLEAALRSDSRWAVRLGEVEATDEREAIEKAAAEFKQERTKLIAVQRQ
jgi:hypothetical protein